MKKTKKTYSKKSRTVSLILAIVLWPFGAHRWYLGKPLTAFLQIITFGGLYIWAFVDIIRIAIGTFKDGKGRTVKNWETE